MTPIAKSPSLKNILSDLMIDKVPAFANKVYYSLGFLSMTSFLMLLVSGLTLTFAGPYWWLTTKAGIYIRSVHLWSAQAFILFIILHVLIVFLTSAYRPPRRLTWVLGGLMFFLALLEAELGYGLRGDFSSQWRTLQAADLYNGSGLGRFINNLNFAQIYGIHIIVIPLIILVLLFLHYLLVKVRGIANPDPRKYQMVRANHKILFARGGVLVTVILILGYFLPSPLILPTTIKSIAQDDPSLVASTLVAEWSHTSDTATYSDNIDPYQYDTYAVYIAHPFEQYAAAAKINNSLLRNFEILDHATRQANLESAGNYFDQNSQLNQNSANPVIAIVSDLTLMAQSGLYEPTLNASGHAQGFTFTSRFLSDTGVLEAEATKLGITTEQYGMLREERGALPPGAWWLAPIGFLDNIILVNDDNQDRDGAEIIGLFVLLFLAFPYIPYLNQVPEKLSLAGWIRRKNI